MELVASQEWPELGVKEKVFLPYKDSFRDIGRGVFALRPFLKGEIVLDYHGKILTLEEGRKISERDPANNYLLAVAKEYFILADAEQCDCHAPCRTYGRLVNYARSLDKACNLKMVPFHLRLGQKNTAKGVFLAARRDIEVLEELRFDYGVSMRNVFCEGEQEEEPQPDDPAPASPPGSPLLDDTELDTTGNSHVPETPTETPPVTPFLGSARSPSTSTADVYAFNDDNEDNINDEIPPISPTKL